MQKYVRRTGAPTKGNLWYTGTAYGGYSNCITSGKGFISRWPGSTMNNCVSTWGRHFEAQAINGVLFGKSDKKDIQEIFAWRPKAASPDLMWEKLKTDRRFKNYCKPTPKQGALAFYKRVAGSGYAGHMCQVERVYSNSRVDFYNNNYATKPLFDYQENRNPATSVGGNFKLLGYLWPMADFEGTKYTTTAVLNCRVGAGTSMAIVGTFGKGVTVTIAGDHKDLDGKVWKKVTGRSRDGKTITGYVDMTYLN